MFKPEYWNSSLFAHLVLGGLFLFLASVGLLTGFLMTHDAIEWHGAFHYFYASVARGVMPYWNPYSQTGTPFFNNFQSFGFLDPSQFLFILLQKLTGCTTLTTYVLQYLFRYYVFILGTYSTLRVLTRHKGNSLLFSLVLFFACFPIFMRQNGALNPFFLLPLTTCYLLMFFQESHAHRKGWYLLIISGLCGVSLNIHIPMFLLFYLLIFIVLVFVFKMTEFKKTVRFLVSRTGLVWTSLALLVIVLLTSPVVALYYELRHTPEYFPSVRLLQYNGNNLVKGYASDLQEDLFAEEFTRNSKTSLTLGNLAGMLFSPFQHFGGAFIQNSEISLYLSILPLFCIGKALRHVKNKYTYFFLVITALLFLITCNFNVQPQGHTSITQRIMLALFPFLKMSDVLQNAGILILFCLIILSAMGFQKMLDEKRRIDWIIPLLILVYKLSIVLPLTVVTEFSLFLNRDLKIRHSFRHILRFVHQNSFLLGIVCVFALLLIMLATKYLISMSHSSSMKLCIGLLFFDLLLVNAFYGLYGRNVKEPLFDGKYFDYLQDKDLLHTKSEQTFINYRIPFSFLNTGSNLSYAHETDDRRIWFNSFFGHEIYSLRKAAFPCVIQVIRSQQTGEDPFTAWDHFYMTTYYYDYLVNVKYDKQPVTSHIISPILNFFPEKNVLFVKDKYKVVEKLNSSSLADLSKYIFVERDRIGHTQTLEVSRFFSPDNYVKYTQEELSDFEQALHRRYSGNSEVHFDIVDYDINHLSLNVETPYNGYVYFGDGYSKHWKAFVDGQETMIEKTNINFKAVYTSAGKHTIEFVFDPVLFRYSLYLYLMGNVLLLTVLIVVIAKRFFSKRVLCLSLS